VSDDAFTVLVEDSTKLSRDEWLASRLPYIGASEAAPSLGMSPWMSQYALWAIKRGLIPDQAMSERFEWALAMEPTILDWWRSHDAWGTAEGQGRRHLMVVSNEYPWMACNPDDLFDNVVVECKTAHSMDEKRWFDPATGQPAVPDHYAIQVMHEMIVTGRKLAVIVVSFGSEAPKDFEVQYDEALAQVIIEGTREMKRRVDEDDPPDVDGSEATMNALRAQFTEVREGEAVEMPARVASLMVERETYAKVAKEAHKIIDHAKAEFMREMGKAEVATVGGAKVATWKKDRNGGRVFRWSTSGGDDGT
jgi:putative phage-type endonuclease